MQKYTLLTGATGLLGTYLVRALLLKGVRLAVVGRASRKQTFEERIESQLQMWERKLGKPLPRPVCLEGNVTEPRIGLNEKAQSWVSRHCERVFHNAAVLTFHGADRNGDPWKTNLGGTGNVVAACDHFGIEELHYVSTAYVCGKRHEKIFEHELAKGQGFQNDYEESKFLSEKLVRESRHIKKLTVYRPAVIAGDSKTGYSSTYHGLGMYLQLMSLMVNALDPDENGVRHTPLSLTCSGEEGRNVVAVDWVSDVMVRLFMTPEAHCDTYHIAPDVQINAKQLIDYCSAYYNATGVVFGVEEHGLNDWDRLAHEQLDVYQDYMENDPFFDMTNTRKFTADLPCPVIDQDAIHRYIRFGEEDKWGKRRLPPHEQPIDVSDFLASSHQEATLSSLRNQDDVTCCGLDVIGPGGGQWTIWTTANGPWQFEAGLPSEDVPVIEMTSDEFASFVNSPPESGHRLRAFLGVNGHRASKEADASLVKSLFPGRQLEQAT
jgi:thioester reductase-like protein